MNRKMLRWIVLGLTLAGTLVATWHLSEQDVEFAPAKAKGGSTLAVKPLRPQTFIARAPVSAAAQRDDVIQLDRLHQRRIEAGSADPFKPLTWYVAPKAPPPPMPVIEKPKAPPFPFQFIGKYLSTAAGAKPVFYLTKGQDSYAVSVGDTVDDVYVLESFADGQLLFIYLPLHERQALSIGNDQ